MHNLPAQNIPLAKIYPPLVECSPELLELIEAHLPTVVPVQHGYHDPTGLLAEWLVGSSYTRGGQAALQFLWIYLAILCVC